tara:strand:+ start:3335 stop:3946 length:612 start_codon:yes stop_codon:yes gene_type:complete
MEYVCLDLEGVLVPEIWVEVAELTGEDQFKLTTQDLKDYSELMNMRMDLVKKYELTMDQITNIVEEMDPFEGSKDFLDWARDNFQLVIVSDTFYQLAWPLIRKLGTPSIICHNLLIEKDEIKGYSLRQNENKKKVVQSLKDLHYKVFASGDSYNDIQMLKEADLGVFFQAPKHIRDEFSDIPAVEDLDALKEKFISASEFINR